MGKPQTQKELEEDIPELVKGQKDRKCKTDKLLFNCTNGHPAYPKTLNGFKAGGRCSLFPCNPKAMVTQLDLEKEIPELVEGQKDRIRPKDKLLFNCTNDHGHPPYLNTVKNFKKGHRCPLYPCNPYGSRPMEIPKVKRFHREIAPLPSFLVLAI